MRIFDKSDSVIQKEIGSRIVANDKIRNDWDLNIHCQGHQNKISGLGDNQKGLLTVSSRCRGGGGCSGTNSFSYNSNFGDWGTKVGISSSTDSNFGDFGGFGPGVRGWNGKSSIEWRSDSSSRWDFSDFGGMNLTEFWFSSGSYKNCIVRPNHILHKNTFRSFFGFLVVFFDVEFSSGNGTISPQNMHSKLDMKVPWFW